MKINDKVKDTQLVSSGTGTGVQICLKMAYTHGHSIKEYLFCKKVNVEILAIAYEINALWV